MAIIIKRSAPCGWLNGACPHKLFLEMTMASGWDNITIFAITGGWISGSCGPSCASDSYISWNASSMCSCASGGDITIDIWKAWEDGLWSSSVALTMYAEVLRKAYDACSPNTGSTGFALTVAAKKGAGGTTVASKTSASGIPGAGSSCPCPTSLFSTLTFYDDGTASWS